MTIRFRARLRRGAAVLLRRRAPLTIQEQFPQYQIGRDTYGDPIIRFDQSQLRIGAFCSTRDGVQIFLGGEHHADGRRRTRSA